MIPKPVIGAAQAAAMVKRGDVVHLGGFLGVGTPDSIVRALVATGTNDLTVVCNDSGIYDEIKGRSTGPAPLIKARACSTIITSHIGTNPETQRQMNSGETKIVLVPQGTLAERVRAAGNGLGGVLTATGVGTEVEEGKQTMLVAGKKYILEVGLPGNVALIKAKKGDRAGNLVYAKTARNFNPLMAMACTLVIAEVEELVEIGDIDPDQVHTPSIFVDYIVKTEQGSAEHA